ncbi:MAG: hypothetical protein OXB84_06745, partial [Halobacteriovoraceae bacterium]|nr:hypothetical protein [Halobacteriovoraceae bacterium]
MKISTGELKKELSKRQEELGKHLTPRLNEMFYWLIHEELDEEDISIFDLIVRIILRADKEPAENIASLMVLLTPEKCYELIDDKWTLSSSAAFVRDYLKKDRIHYILKRKKNKKLLAKDQGSSSL